MNAKLDNYDLYRGRIEASLNSGTVEQRFEKIARYVAQNESSVVVGATIAERVEREVMYERPGADPRTDPRFGSEAS